MAVTKDQVLAALNGVRAPDGTPLPATRTLSDIVVADGKVFFSLTVDAAVVQSWEAVRKAAEQAVRALPDVKSALVALTAERAASAGAPPPPGRASPAARPHAHGHGGGGGPAAQAPPGVKASWNDCVIPAPVELTT